MNDTAVQHRADEPGPIQVDLDRSPGDWKLVLIIFLFCLLLGGYAVQTLRANNAEDASHSSERARSCQSAYSSQFFFAQAEQDATGADLARENAKIQSANNKLIRGIILDGAKKNSGDALIREADAEATAAVDKIEDITKKLPSTVDTYRQAALDLKRVAREAVTDRAAFDRSCSVIKKEKN